MNKITYTSVQHWKDVKRILEKEPTAKLVAWPSSMCEYGFILAYEYVTRCNIGQPEGSNTFYEYDVWEVE